MQYGFATSRALLPVAVGFCHSSGGCGTGRRSVVAFSVVVGIYFIGADCSFFTEQCFRSMLMSANADVRPCECRQLKTKNRHQLAFTHSHSNSM